jgi:hypothetical protein
VRLPSVEVAMDSDEQVRGVIRLVFEKFDALGTARSVFRYLLGAKIRIGVRPNRGPRRGELVWRPPTRSAIERILRHPIYAGAYAYGRYRYTPQPVRGSRPACQTIPLDKVQALLRDKLPAYITWDQFQSNLATLRANRSGPATPGAVRTGAGLLGGLIRCGTCGRRLTVHYRRPGGQAHYTCDRYSARGGDKGGEQTCYGVVAAPVDELVTAQVLRALEPAALELSLQAGRTWLKNGTGSTAIGGRSANAPATNTPTQIAEALNAAGFRTPRRRGRLPASGFTSCSGGSG